MNNINRGKIKIKNLIGIVDDPVGEDLLFEIVDFLEREGRLDGVFSKAEVSLKTRCRIQQDIADDLGVLCDLGYIKKRARQKYTVLRHPWEKKNEEET